MSVKVATIPNRIATIMIGANRGIVMSKKRRQNPAPSTSACSLSSGGIEVSPAIRITAASGKVRHACSAITDPTASESCPNQATGAPWSTTCRLQRTPRKADQRDEVDQERREHHRSQHGLPVEQVMNAEALVDDDRAMNRRFAHAAAFCPESRSKKLMLRFLITRSASSSFENSRGSAMANFAITFVSPCASLTRR